MIITAIPIREISTLAILVPLCLAIRFILTADTPYRLFFIFLLMGLATDLFGWYVSSHMHLLTALVYVSTYYSVLESLFFTRWIAWHSSRTIKTMARVVTVVSVIWIIFLPFNGIAQFGTLVRLTLFDAFYQTAVSFLSGFALLKIIEQEGKPFTKPDFWILAGIFIYCFSTFFVFVLKSSVAQEFADKLWPIHNLVNIITYMFYSIGLYVHKSPEKIKS